MEDVGCLQASASEIVSDKKPLTWKDGLRLVDLYELAKQMHCKTCASLLDLMNTQSETRWGFASVLSVLCSCCQTLNDIYTGKVNETDAGKTEFEVNMKASVNLLLCGTGREHVINFLAVVNVPQPAPEDPSILTPSALDLPGPLQAGSGPGRKACSAEEQSQAAKAATSQDLLRGESTTPLPQHVPAIRIKTEVDEELARSRQTDGQKMGTPTRGRRRTEGQMLCRQTEGQTVCAPTPGRKRTDSVRIRALAPGGKDKQKMRQEKKRKTSGAAATAASADLVDEAVGVGEVAEKKEGAASVESVDSGVVNEEEEEMGVAKAVKRKHYMCPLCGRILPSSRGFHIHVGRKHQASNLQAIHYEIGPDDFSTGNKDQKPGDEDPLLVQQSHSAPPHHARSSVYSSPDHQKNSAAETLKSSASETSPPEEERMSDTTTEDRPFLPNSTPCPEDGSPPGRLKLAAEEDAAGVVVCRILNCGKTLQSQGLYRRHLQKVHGISSPFCCPQCAKQYSSQRSLNIHMTVAHCTTDERKAVCKYCGDTVEHRRALKRHIKAQHPRGSKRTFYCDECPMTFPLPSALKNHKLKHSGVKNYQCFYCDKRFSGSGNRLNHMRYFHEKERKFLCDTCGAGFYRAYALREHERVHSGEKPYQCERCAERFTKKEYLTIHMRTHTGEKPYKCELCDKAFTQRTSRSLHRRKVHGIKKQEPAGSNNQKEVLVNNKTVFVSG